MNNSSVQFFSILLQCEGEIEQEVTWIKNDLGTDQGVAFQEVTCVKNDLGTDQGAAFLAFTQSCTAGYFIDIVVQYLLISTSDSVHP